MKILLGLILCLTFQGIFLESSFALLNSNVREFLENRVDQWPELYLPNFKLSDTSKDLIYPKWFEGNWLVTSQDIVNDLYMRIFQSRENLYSQADLRIQVKSENIEEVAMKIINAIHKEIIN